MIRISCSSSVGRASQRPSRRAHAYAQQWNFDVQRELPGSMALSLAYAGSKGTHLPGPTSRLDQLPPRIHGAGQQAATAGPESVLWVGAIGRACATDSRLWPAVAAVSAVQRLRRCRALLTATRSITRHRSTWRSGSGAGAPSSERTRGPNSSATPTRLTGWLEPGGGAGGVQDNYNIRAERSLALYDTPHRLVVSYIVDLPFGKGRQFGADVRRRSQDHFRMGHQWRHHFPVREPN